MSEPQQFNSFQALGQHLGHDSSEEYEQKETPRKTGTIEEHEQKEPSRKTGTIKKVLQGFGFIQISGEKQDIHFRFKSFNSRVNKGQIREGVQVTFTVGEGRNAKTTALDIEIANLSEQSGTEKVRPKTLGGVADHYFLPSDTLALLKTALVNQNRVTKREQIDNFALLLQKCAYYDPKGETFLFYKKDLFELSPVFDAPLLQSIQARQRLGIQQSGLANESLALAVDWRLIVGLGNESVYETSMTLHHIYGIPYIPGQAVKGMLRSWMIQEYFGQNEKNEFNLEHAEKRALGTQWFCDMFGCPKEQSFYKEARQGSVIFFDAFPTELKPESIQPDIMNPHYGPYYSDGKPPADYHNPVPVNFLTVTKTMFEFYIGVNEEKNITVNARYVHGQLLDIAKQALITALNEHGIGAKTAIGYGYFRE